MAYTVKTINVNIKLVSTPFRRAERGELLAPDIENLLFIVYCYFILNNINICKKYMQEMLVFIAVGVEEFDYFFFGR
jgi:type IV secretory pathway TrbL component